MQSGSFYDEYKSSEPEDFRIKFANATWRASECMNRIRATRKKKSLKIISEVPLIMPKPHQGKIALIKCQSLTMSGKPCPFKATSDCGRFCKKHIL
jgi:hypothetical protein